jgi:hypothetical protein
MKTAVVVALAGAALLAEGCSGRSDAVGHPASTTPRAGVTLILRTRTTGGIAGFGGPGSRPDFSLYADGRAIVGNRSPVEYHLTAAAVRRLVRAATDAGLTRRHDVTDPQMADAIYKVITFVTGGRPVTSKVVQPGGGTRIAAFLADLDPARWPRTDLTAAPHPYRPERLAVLAVPVAGGTGPAWPLHPLGAGTPVGTSTCTVLTGGDIARAERLAAKGGQWTDHNRAYRVTLRPLLPDEPGCAALT